MALVNGVQLWRKLILAAVVTGIALGFAASGAIVSLDRMLADQRFAFTDRPASGRTVFIDIDSASLSEVGVWPWPRHVHATLLDRLMAAGSDEVAFDIDFSNRSDASGDAAFASALESAGGYAYLAAFEQHDGSTGNRFLNRPIETFAQFAEAVAVNVIAGTDGRVDRVATQTQGIDSMAVALSGRDVAEATIAIDFGIDLGTVDRISAADVMAGRFDPARVAGRQAVVGASAIELRDIFAVPRFGLTPGPLVQIAAVETLRADRALTSLGWLPAGLAAILAAVGWAMFGARLPLLAIAASAAGIAVASEVAALLVQGAFATTFTTSPLLLALPLLVGLDSAARFYAEYRGRRLAEQKLAWLALHDQVTGLPSRQGFLSGPAGGQDGAVVLVGLQRLDTVRGALGHEIADLALKQVAERLKALHLGELGAIDKDVLAVALPGRMDSVAAEVIAARIREALRPAISVGGHTIHVDAHLAACCAPSEDTGTRLRRAELALTLEGDSPGSINRYAPELESGLDRRRNLDTALRRALDAGELRLAFQPQALLSSGEIIGAEALVRWHDPEFGEVSPGEFVPLAEESGLIIPIGAFVIMEACRIAATRQWAGQIAVNVSSMQFRMTDVVELVSDALFASGLDPSRLELEITESVLIEGDARLAAALKALRQLGVGIAIDDFGTGYSSLSYLTRLSFDKLKIDQSFVRRMLESPDDAAVVQSIVELAARLGKRTVAEGIETEAQLSKLVSMGCDVGQGWLIGRPVSADDIDIRLAGPGLLNAG